MITGHVKTAAEKYGSSDYYLRLTRDGGKMLKGEIPLTFTRPTKPVE